MPKNLTLTRSEATTLGAALRDYDGPVPPAVRAWAVAWESA